MRQAHRIHSKIIQQTNKIRKTIFRIKDSAYAERMYSANFTSSQFINSVYMDQPYFKRRDEEERVKCLITFVTEKIKDSMKTVEQPESDHGKKW